MNKTLSVIACVLLVFIFFTNCNKKIPSEPGYPPFTGKAFGGSGRDGGHSVQQTTDNGYIIVGETRSIDFTPDDIFLIKTDTNGNSVWTKTYGGSNYDYGRFVQQTNDGGYFIAGTTYSFGAGGMDAYLIKTDSNGDCVWAKTYGGTAWDFAHSGQQTNDGGYVAAGSTSVWGSGHDDVYIIKVDSGGNQVWTKTFGGTGNESSNSVHQTSDGGYVLAGLTDSFGAGNKDVYLIKTDASGNCVWTRTFGSGGYDVGTSVKQTSDSGYIIAGATSLSDYDIKVHLIKTDANGDCVWAKTFGTDNYGIGYSVQQTTDSGYILAGGYDHGKLCLIKTDSDGILSWLRVFYENAYEEGRSVQQTNDGGYIITGSVEIWDLNSEIYPDIYLIKTDASGNKIW